MEQQRVMDEVLQRHEEAMQHERTKAKNDAKNLLEEINQMQQHIDRIARSEEIVRESQESVKKDC